MNEKVLLIQIDEMHYDAQVVCGDSSIMNYSTKGYWSFPTQTLFSQETLLTNNFHFYYVPPEKNCVTTNHFILGNHPVNVLIVTLTSRGKKSAIFYSLEKLHDICIPIYIILLNAIIHKKAPSKLEIIDSIILFVGIEFAFEGNRGSESMIDNLCAMLSALFYAGVYFFSKQDGANTLESLLNGNSFSIFRLPLLVRNKIVIHTNQQTWAFLIFFGFQSYFRIWYCFTNGIRNASYLQASFIALDKPVMTPPCTYQFFTQREITAFPVRIHCSNQYINRLQYCTQQSTAKIRTANLLKSKTLFQLTSSFLFSATSGSL